MKASFSFLACIIASATISIPCAWSADAKALPPLPIAETIAIQQMQLHTAALPAELKLREPLGLVTAAAIDGQVVHRTKSRILETRATITPNGDFLLLFPEGDHYAKSKGEKMNVMLAYRSKDRGLTWQGPTVAYDIPYSQHGFIPFIPKGTNRIYAFGTQPIPDKYSWKDGQQENAPIGHRYSDDDGHTWSEVALIKPENDPGYLGMSVMRMTETDAGTWLLGSHLADWSVKPIKTKQYLLRSEDKGKTWTLLPGSRPNGWFAEGFDRMDEGRPINLGKGKVLFMSRTPQGHLFTAWSEDDGKTWTKPAPCPLVHPDAPPMLFPLSDGKTLVAFHHRRVPKTQPGELSDKAETMKMRTELWISTTSDGGHTWTEPRFAMVNAVEANLAVGGFNHQCSYLDAFMDGEIMHLFLPHRWQQVLHLTLKESAIPNLPTQADLEREVAKVTAR